VISMLMYEVELIEATIVGMPHRKTLCSRRLDEPALGTTSPDDMIRQSTLIVLPVFQKNPLQSLHVRKARDWITYSACITNRERS